MAEDRTFHVLTHGCKINQYESQALSEKWQAAGGREAAGIEAAAVIVINSCAVTEKALQEVRKAVRRCRRVNRGAHIVVTGCAAQACGPELEALPEVDRVVPQAEKAAMTPWPDGGEWPAPTSPATFPDFRISRFPRARPVVKVQDGCSHRCTYCIVPSTRGPARSRDEQEVILEVARLFRAGYREVVLSGINLSQYRVEGRDFWDLLRSLDRSLAPAWGQEARLRLSSLDPSQLTPKALTVLAESRMLCPHLHVSMQSASPDVLRGMGRAHYQPEKVANFFQDLSAVWPRYALGADFLVGFPGETGEDMARTLHWLETQPFTYAHVFAFSPRPGTPAAERTDQVPPEVKKERSRRLRAAAGRKGLDFVRKAVESPRVRVVLEGLAPGHGRSEDYISCTFVQEPAAGANACVPAVPVRADGHRLLVRPA